MKNKTLIGLLALIAPTLSFSQGQQNFSCSMGELTRRVEVVSEPGVSVPCEVHYYKDSEATDERQVLWSAMNEAGYCEAKTQEFVAKLSDMGWNCDQTQMMQTMPSENPAPAAEEADAEIEIDDTADLAPAPTDPR